MIATPRRIVTREQLAQIVWDDTDVNPNRLEQHIAGVRRKLEANGASRLLHTVRGVGYVVRP